MTEKTFAHQHLLSAVRPLQHLCRAPPYQAECADLGEMGYTSPPAGGTDGKGFGAEFGAVLGVVKPLR